MKPKIICYQIMGTKYVEGRKFLRWKVAFHKTKIIMFFSSFYFSPFYNVWIEACCLCVCCLTKHFVLAIMQNWNLKYSVFFLLMYKSVNVNQIQKVKLFRPTVYSDVKQCFRTLQQSESIILFLPRCWTPHD